MNSGPSWQWPQSRIAHFMLRSSDTWIASERDAALLQRGDREAHHHLGPADHRHGVVGVEGRARDERRDDADAPAPARRRLIDGDLDLDVEASAPALELGGVEQLLGRAAAVEHDDVAVALAVGEHVVDRRPQRREPDPAGEHDDVGALGRFDRPGGAERAAHADHVAAPQRRTARRSTVPTARIVWISGRRLTRDRHLALAERVEHRELARGQRLELRVAWARARASTSRGSPGAGARPGRAPAPSRPPRGRAQRPGTWP